MYYLYNQDMIFDGYRQRPMPYFFNQPPYHLNNPYSHWDFYPMHFYPWMHQPHHAHFYPQHGPFTYGQHQHQHHHHRIDQSPQAPGPNQPLPLRDYGPQPISLNIFCTQTFINIFLTIYTLKSLKTRTLLSF